MTRAGAALVRTITSMELPSSFSSLTDKLLEFLEVSSLIVCQVFRELPLLCLRALL